MPEVFTIGHSNHSAGRFIELLHQHKISMLVDVRSKPRSRMPHFNRDNLIELVRKNDVDYRYGGTILGGFSTLSVTTPVFKSKMQAILDMADEGQRVAMMCSEGKFWECHRAGKLTAYLHREFPDVGTSHIMTDGTLTDAKEGEHKVLKDVFWHEYQQPKLL